MEYQEINLIKIKRDVQTDEVQLVLQTTYLGKKVEMTITRDKLTLKGLAELTKQGFPILSKDEANATIYDIISVEEQFPIENTYKTVGWHEIEGKTYFLHRKALRNGKIKKVFYNGNLDLSSKGEYKDSLDFFNAYIASNTGLEVVCAVSLSASMISLFEEKDLRFIFHIEGLSTSGKTTSLMLAGSLWGNPKVKANGVIKSWNTTDNKLMKSACGNKGIPIGLDELSMSDANNTKLTYILTSGNDKQRMTNDDESISDFNTAFISTGEIKFKESNYGGIAVRLFEVKNYNFTKNKETADLILENIQANYGHIGFKFAKELSKLSKKCLNNNLSKETERVISHIKKHCEERNIRFSPLFGRMAEKIAVIVLSAKIAKKKMNMNFDAKAIRDFLICDTTLLEAGQEQSVEAMDKFLEEYAKNKTKFPKDNVNDSNIWGKSIFRNGELYEVVVLYNQFVKMMNRLGFPDTTSLIKALKEKNFIKCEKDKNYARRDVGNLKKTKVIVVNVLAIKGGADDEN